MNNGSGFGNEYRWGVSQIFSLRSKQKIQLSHEQRLRLKKVGRPCPKIQYKWRTSESVSESIRGSVVEKLKREIAHTFAGLA